MTLAQGARDVAAWPRRRLALGVAITIVLVLALAALSGLPPFGAALGAGWRYPLLALLAAGMGLYGATGVRSPIGAEMTLCDLRWPAVATIGVAYAGRDATFSPALVALFGLAAVTLMFWAVVQRLERERAAVRDGDSEVCLTCRPLFAQRPGRGAHAGARVIQPLDPGSVRREAAVLERGERP